MKNYTILFGTFIEMFCLRQSISKGRDDTEVQGGGSNMFWRPGSTVDNFAWVFAMPGLDVLTDL